MRIIKQASYNIDTTGHLGSEYLLLLLFFFIFFFNENEQFWLLRMNNFVKDVGFILIIKWLKRPNCYYKALSIIVKILILEL